MDNNNKDDRRERADEFTSSVERLWQCEEQDQQQREENRAEHSNEKL
jgi:hypothetical protein